MIDIENLPGKVVHCQSSSYDIYIGRWNPKMPQRSKWANPFKIGKDGNRKEILDKYKEWIQTQDHLMDSLEELRGKTLGCWCAPSFCHGHILLHLLQEQKELDE